MATYKLTPAEMAARKARNVHPCTRLRSVLEREVYAAMVTACNGAGVPEDEALAWIEAAVRRCRSNFSALARKHNCDWYAIR